MTPKEEDWVASDVAYLKSRVVKRGSIRSLRLVELFTTTPIEIGWRIRVLADNGYWIGRIFKVMGFWGTHNIGDDRIIVHVDGEPYPYGTTFLIRYLGLIESYIENPAEVREGEIPLMWKFFWPWRISYKRLEKSGS